jgi:sulfite exporter TauE/SafE
LKIYVDLFLTGIALGSGPCLYFCAPILLPYIAATQKGWLEGLKITLAFSFARVVSYVSLSLISATIGQYLIRRFYETQAGTIIYLTVGVFISLLGILIVIGKSLHLHFCPPFKGTAYEGIKEMILLGLVVGFAPCLPLFGVLTYIAFHSQNFLHGALLGLSFGVGTIVSPLILLGSMAGGTATLLLKKEFVHKIFSRLCGLALLYLGVSMIIRTLRTIYY